MNAFEMNHVTRRYKDFCLENINLSLPSGCILGLIGENGAGKSTLIRLLTGLEAPDGGTVRVLGEENGQKGHHIRQRLGIVLEQQGFPDMTAIELSRLLAPVFPAWDQEKYLELLRRLSVPEDRRYLSLSAGTQRKLSLCTALCRDPELLVLDESTNGLDPVAREEVVSLLMDYTRDERHSVFIASHIVSDLEKLCDEVAFLHRGKLLLVEEKDALLERYCRVQCTRDDLRGLPPSDVLSVHDTGFGVQAVIARRVLPPSLPFIPVSLEDLFVSMIRGAA